MPKGWVALKCDVCGFGPLEYRGPNKLECSKCGTVYEREDETAGLSHEALSDLSDDDHCQFRVVNTILNGGDCTLQWSTSGILKL
jgi:hypothetical protein